MEGSFLWSYVKIVWIASQILKQEGHDGPWWPWITHRSHFPHKMNSTFFVTIVPTCDPRGGASFDPRGIIWVKLIKVHKAMLHTKNQSFRLPGSEKKNFEFCLLCSNVRICDPGDGANLDPTGVIWTNLIEVHKEIMHTKYQSSMPSSSQEKEFWSLPSLFLRSNLWPPWRSQSWPQEHHLNKLGRGPQGDAAYQISKLYAFHF